jgi:hypothetical protein
VLLSFMRLRLRLRLRLRYFFCLSFKKKLLF